MFLAVLFLFLAAYPVNAQTSSPPPLATNPTEAPTPSPSSPSATTAPTVTPIPTIDPLEAQIKQYKDDYLFNYHKYQEAYTIYTEKKQIHTKYGTITTEAEKIDATKIVLIARNNALRTYLTALRLQLDKYKPANPTDTEKNQIELRKWESWLDEQNSVVTVLNNQKDIVKWAQEYKIKWIEIQSALYQALIQHGVNQRHQTLKEVTLLANNIQSSDQINQESLEWFNRLPILSDQVKEGTKRAVEISTKKQITNRFTNFYPSSRAELIKSDGYLLQIVNNLKSIVIKFGQ